jgi:hypothetical protein
VSHFSDGDATITLDELRRDWHNWPALERIDFCQSFCNSARVPERVDILRFIVAHGEHDSWSAIALSVAQELPLEESLPVLRLWCQTCEVGCGANYYQAVALTGDPEAHALLKKCFERTWQSSRLLDTTDSFNGGCTRRDSLPHIPLRVERTAGSAPRRVRRTHRASLQGRSRLRTALAGSILRR